MSSTQNTQEVNLLVIGSNDDSNFRFINTYLGKEADTQPSDSKELFFGSRTYTGESGDCNVKLYCITKANGEMHLTRSDDTLKTMDGIIYIYPSTQTVRDISGYLQSWPVEFATNLKTLDKNLKTKLQSWPNEFKTKHWFIWQDGEKNVELKCSSALMKDYGCKKSTHYRCKLESAKKDWLIGVC